jgi:glycine/D-amino acid oxidase-like deaminating enzyme
VHEQCTTLGVEFYFEHKIVNVDFAVDTGVSGVQIRDVSNEDSIIDMPCSNLVLAAGAFTTGIFETLFTKAPLKLQNHLKASDWFLVRSAQADFTESAAFRFPNAAGSEERLGNEICMVIDSERNIIAISGMAAHIRDKSLNTSLVKDPSHGKISELQRVAAECLNTTLIDVQEKITTGRRHRWELSMANGMSPIIDGVPRSWAGPSNAAAAETQMPHGVWLCYGFGKYGTVLAPGVAKILLARMGNNDEYVSTDIDAFRLPNLQLFRDEDMMKINAKGKGKGKAKVV